MIAITKPFALLMAKTVNLSNKVFQWCRRQRRSLAIATIAFVLGFALGVWLLPRESETWAKINNLRQKIIEKARGTAQVAGAKPSPTAPTSSLKGAAHCIFGGDGGPNPSYSSPIRRRFSLENGRRHNSFLGR